MNEANFCKRMGDLVTGDGFWRDVSIPLQAAHLQSDGSPLTVTLTTNPGWIKADTNVTVLAWAADKVVEAGIGVDIPGDYDETQDALVVWLLAKMSGSTATTTALKSAVYAQDAPTTDLAPDQTADLTSAYQWVKFDLSGKGLSANDHLHLTLYPEAHATDAVYVSAIKLRYRGDLAIFDEDERSSGTAA